jgi:glycosyltransferase involved in cell wall biosynthesis
MEQVCGNACFYYDEETPEALAAAMKEAIENYAAVRRKLNPSIVCKNYSLQATITRIRRMLQAMGVLN